MRVMRSKVVASTASMLTVMRFRPASLSGCASESSRWPLVVRARSSLSPLMVRRRESSRTRSTTSRQQRLPAREANFGDAEADKDADEAEVFIEGQLRILRAHFAGAAVYAFVVAAVGDGDTQVVDHAAVTIREHRMRRLRRECGDGRGSHWQLQAYTLFGAA